MISAAKTFGEYVTDLKAEIIIKDNRQILRLVEAMKATPGVKTSRGPRSSRKRERKSLFQTMWSTASEAFIICEAGQ